MGNLAQTRRHAGASTPVMPWVITGLFGLVLLGDGTVWLGAQAGAEHGWPVPGITELPLTMHRHGLAGVLGSHGSPLVFWAVVLAVVIATLTAATVVTLMVTRTRQVPDGRKALTNPRSFRDLQRRAMTARAQGLSPSLEGADPKTIDPRRIGARLGSILGEPVYKSLEDVEVMICGPRAYKTSAKVVPEILCAPGPVIVTSNKPDVWILTHALRAKVGKTYLFDSQRLTYQPQTWWWNPLSCVTDVESASRLAGYFMREVGQDASGGTNRADPFFTPAAAKTLRQLLLAAACSGKSLREVVIWIALRSDEPAAHLENQGFAAQAASLRSTLELPAETRGGIYEGAATAVACLDSENLLRWVTPPDTWTEPPEDELPELDLWDLITPPGAPNPTLYLLCREGEGSGRPIVAALFGEYVHIAVRAATAQGGRLDPVAAVILDEAANIVRLPELPAWMSWFGSTGLMVTVILQSRGQGRGAWERLGFDALWSAATIKTIGAGIADPDFAEDLSRLVGEHKVVETSTSYSSGGHSTSRTLRTERILTAADIAALHRRSALLFTSGRRPGMLTLHPWFDEQPDEEFLNGAAITRYAREATEQVREAAIGALGPHHAITRYLAGSGAGSSVNGPDAPGGSDNDSDDAAERSREGTS